MADKKILITGASKGIGRAVALRCAREGEHVLVCARRKELLNELVQEIQNLGLTKAHAIELDVSNHAAVNQAFRELPEFFNEIDVCINNAGLALGLDALDQQNIEDIEIMIDVNVKGLIYVTRAILPMMRQRNSGHIINVGSISGREVYPGGNAYCATKRMVKSITEGLKVDVHGTQIKVTEIGPGIVETDFAKVRFHQDEKRAREYYERNTFLTAEDVADAIYYCLSRPTHVNIRELFLTATCQTSCTMVAKRTQF